MDGVPTRLPASARIRNGGVGLGVQSISGTCATNRAQSRPLQYRSGRALLRPQRRPPNCACDDAPAGDYVAMENRVEVPVCLCRRVRAGAIRQSVRDGARSLEDIRRDTGAAAACTSCEGDVEALLHAELILVRAERARLGSGHPDQMSLFGSL